MRDSGNGNSGGLGEAAELVGELGIGGGEGFKAVEERIDEDGRGKDQGGHDGQGGEPGAEPPAFGRPANDCVQGPYGEGTEEDGEQFSLGPVGEPGAPTLHAESVGSPDVLAVNFEWKFKECESEQQRWNEDDGLGEAPLGNRLDHPLHLGTEACGDERHENPESEDGGSQRQGQAGPVQGFGFLELGGRESVGGDGALGYEFSGSEGGGGGWGSGHGASVKSAARVGVARPDCRALFILSSGAWRASGAGGELRWRRGRRGIGRRKAVEGR